MTKSGGFTGNMAKLGGKSSKLKLKSDMASHHMVNSTHKKARKQAHKKV